VDGIGVQCDVVKIETHGSHVLLAQHALSHHIHHINNMSQHCNYSLASGEPSVLLCCWLGSRKGIRPVKKLEWWGTGMVICVERDANMHMAQLMPMSLASVKSRMVLPFWYRLTGVIPEKGPLNGCVFWGAWGRWSRHVTLPRKTLVSSP